MRRALLKITAAASLLLCVAIVALWVRSHYVSDTIGRIHYAPQVPNEDHHVYLQSNCGILTLTWGGDPAEALTALRAL